MNVLNIFTEAYKERVLQKTNQGVKARMSEFGAIVADITAIHGAIPDIARIRAYFFKCLSTKPNWGCRQVIEVLDYTVSQIRGVNGNGY